MQINIIYDQDQSTLPAGFVSAVNYVVNYFDNLFTNNVVINIDLGFGEIHGGSLSGAVSQSQPGGHVDVAYTDVQSALLAENAPGASSLPDSNPLSGPFIRLPPAEAKALGFSSSTTNIDGYIGISNTYSFSYTPGVAPSAGEYYFVGALEHEITAIMGRVSYIQVPPYSVLDLYRYSAAGTHDVTVGDQTYFSIDGGHTFLQAFAANAGSYDLALGPVQMAMTPQMPISRPASSSLSPQLTSQRCRRSVGP